VYSSQLTVLNQVTESVSVKSAAIMQPTFTVLKFRFSTQRLQNTVHWSKHKQSVCRACRPSHVRAMCMPAPCHTSVTWSPRHCSLVGGATWSR